MKKLLKKPNMKKCTFAEYRNWVIINLLLNNGCRAATIRNIQIKDVDIENKVIYLRHTKNKRAQVIPLCEALCGVLREYMRVRGGGRDDYLFPNENGVQLTENGLRCTISKYNKRHGVEKTGIHLFRHTFAKKYLVDCGGNAFTLQRLLGHSTLDMTKHYCAIFDADITRDFDNYSPLAQLRGAENSRIKMERWAIPPLLLALEIQFKITNSRGRLRNHQHSHRNAPITAPIYLFYQAIFTECLDIPIRETLCVKFGSCPPVPGQIRETLFCSAGGFLGVGLPVRHE